MKTIIEMAQKCGLLIDINDRLSTSRETSFHVEICYFNIERFVAIIDAAEREACAKVCEDSVEYAGDELARQIRARGNK